MDAIILPSPEEGGSSGHGMSYWTSFLKCARRGRLDRDSQGAAFGGDARVGVFFHKMLEHYHQGQRAAMCFQYPQGPEDADFLEALRLFRTYEQLHTPTEFGEVLACEELFQFTTAQSLKIFGVEPFTGRVDMVVKSPDQEGCDRLTVAWGLPLEPGSVYYLDTKTKKQHSFSLIPEMMHSQQFHAYMMAGHERGIDVKGMIVNVVVRHVALKPTSFVKLLVPFPTQMQQDAVRYMLSKARDLRTRYGEEAANPAHCFDYHRECPYLGAQCDRV